MENAFVERMTTERIATLKNKEVINVRDGQRLGYVCDVAIDVKCGRVVSLIIPASACMWGFLGRDKEYVIDWCCIVKIGEDIILVDADTDCLINRCKE
jgi:YlmC/YmxH family sporulation protein